MIARVSSSRSRRYLEEVEAGPAALEVDVEEGDVDRPGLDPVDRLVVARRFLNPRVRLADLDELAHAGPDQALVLENQYVERAI